MVRRLWHGSWRKVTVVARAIGPRYVDRVVLTALS
jgi:hypothetical protein